MSGRPSGSPGTSHRWLRALAVAGAATTASLVGIGGLVRATGSGLGCPGWPKCFGRWLPPIEYHALIEYAHRAAASVVIVLIGLLAAVAVARYRRVRRIVVPAVAALGLVFIQAALGAIVVEGKLEALLVTAHFGTAVILLGVLAYVAVAAFSIGARPVRRDGLTRLAVSAAGATFVLLAVGAYVRGEGAGLAFPDWPLMDGRVIPQLSTVPRALHVVHRLLAGATALLAASVAVWAWRERSARRPVARLAVATAVLFVAQALVGAANVWTGLAPAAVMAHVTLAGAVWALAVATVAAAHLLPAGDAVTVSPEAADDHALDRARAEGPALARP